MAVSITEYPRLSTCILLFIFLTNPVFSQRPNPWVSLPKDKWPTIALTNHVLYKNGDQYIHPSFTYAATGFLLADKNDTFAVTAKHVLWIARNKKSQSVSVNRDLRQWIMKSKGADKDSVIIDDLINEDTTEILEGSSSTILERDVLVFSVKSASSGVQPLRPTYSLAKPGETVFIIGHPYSKSRQTIIEGRVLSQLGMDILIEQFPNDDIGGLSGSPVVDAEGFLIGIFSSTTSFAGKTVSVAISTEYLQNIFEHKRGLNLPKQDYGELIYQTVLKSGTTEAIRQYETLVADPENFYLYNLRSANRNGLRETGEKLIEQNRFQEAIDMLTFNVKLNSGYFHNYNLLAKAWLLAGNRDKAVENYKISITKLKDRNANEAFKELEKLGVVLEKN